VIKKVLLAVVGVLVLGIGALVAGAADTAPHYVPGKRTAVTSPGHAEERVAMADGTKLLLQSWLPAEKPRGVLILVHGLKDYGDRYAELATASAAAGFATYALDLRGHGDSEGDRVWVERFDQYVEDLAAVHAHIVQAQPGLPVFLFGHSMGGAIVTLFVEDKHPALAGLITSGGALGLDAPAALIAAAKLFSAIAPRMGILELDDSTFCRDQKVVASMKNDPMIFDGKGPARTGAELIGAVQRVAKHFDAVTMPLLAMHGGADAVTPPSGSKQLAAAAGSKDVTLKIYEGDFHDLLHEPNAAEVRGDIVAWLTAHVPTSAPAAAQ
jgi:alpha-beta hydrolase superfamily lysophospholipase